MELELVEDAGGERELRDAGAVDEHVLVARGSLGLGHRGRDVVDVGDQRPLRRSLSGSRRLRMKIGTPSWWSPPQPPAGSKVPRPATTAPVDMNSSMTWPLTPATRSDGAHSCRRWPPSPSPLSTVSLGPAMNPSRDMDM